LERRITNEGIKYENPPSNSLAPDKTPVYDDAESPDPSDTVGSSLSSDDVKPVLKGFQGGVQGELDMCIAGELSYGLMKPAWVGGS
jgi:hypothetical protein